MNTYCTNPFIDPETGYCAMCGTNHPIGAPAARKGKAPKKLVRKHEPKQHPVGLDSYADEYGIDSETYQGRKQKGSEIWGIDGHSTM